MLARNQTRKPFTQRPNAMMAVLIIAALCIGGYLLIHEFEDYIHLHPMAILMYPLTGMLVIAAVLPLTIFITYEDDFKGLTPIIPTHLVRIYIKAFTALHKNEWKLAEKDF